MTPTPAVYQRTEAEALSAQLQSDPDLDFAVLVGSRASGTAQPTSDWDIALAWKPEIAWGDVLQKTERLRDVLARALGVSSTQIDLVDLRSANLAMRASVAEDGVALYGDNSAAWARFLRRTWRELEDYYWGQNHAA